MEQTTARATASSKGVISASIFAGPPSGESLDWFGEPSALHPTSVNIGGEGAAGQSGPSESAPVVLSEKERSDLWEGYTYKIHVDVANELPRMVKAVTARGKQKLMTHYGCPEFYYDEDWASKAIKTAEMMSEAANGYGTVDAWKTYMHDSRSRDKMRQDIDSIKRHLEWTCRLPPGTAVKLYGDTLFDALSMINESRAWPEIPLDRLRFYASAIAESQFPVLQGMRAKAYKKCGTEVPDSNPVWEDEERYARLAAMSSNSAQSG